MWPIITLLAFALISIVVVALGVLRRRKKLSPSQKSRLIRDWHSAIAIQDESRRVLEAEKVIDGLFLALGYSGSFGEKLKVIGPRLQNIDAIWRAHKLRNRIAHETGFIPSASEVSSSMKAFEQALNYFIR